MGEVMNVRHALAKGALTVAAAGVLAGSTMAASANAATYPATSYTNTYAHTSTYQEWRQEWKWTYGPGDYSEQIDTQKRDTSGAGYNEAVTEWHPSAHNITKHTVETSWTKTGKVTDKNEWSYS